jgi:hypothetical protein
MFVFVLDGVFVDGKERQFVEIELEFVVELALKWTEEDPI